jgi:hypothetical protein
MPIYIFKCEQCQSVEEYLLGVGKTPDACKACDNETEFTKQMTYPKHFYGLPMSSDNAHSDTFKEVCKSGNGYE